VALLLAAGADGEARSSDGATALQYAQQKKATGSMALLAGAQRHAKAPQAAPAPAGSRAAPAEAKFKHCPVAQGQCAECHDSHKSSREHLLKKAGQALCLNCHDRKDVSAIKAHAAIGDGDCTMCHDPHRSDNKALLRTAKP
jgi:predicted CXXCH cytochrome family protein